MANDRRAIKKVTYLARRGVNLSDIMLSPEELKALQARASGTITTEAMGGLDPEAITEASQGIM